MTSARSCAISAIVMLLFTALGLLLFATIHWRNGWPVFVLLPYLLAVLVPNICRNCTPLEELDTRDIQWDEATMKNCRELGWCFALLFMLSAYSVPVLAWYNAGFSCAGASLIMVALTCMVWAYLLVVRVFGPFKNQ